jgi:hypothetical protein
MKKLILFFISLSFLIISCAQDDTISTTDNLAVEENSSQDNVATTEQDILIDSGDNLITDNIDSAPDIDNAPPIICTPGATQPCYSGPSGTKGVGICKGGISTCNEDGTKWSECKGEILPQPETCGDNIDQDCDGNDMTTENAKDIDGDGFTYCDGDCCELPSQCPHPELVGPGAFEIADNKIDDNCNGKVDEPQGTCDDALSVKPYYTYNKNKNTVSVNPNIQKIAQANAMALVKGMGLCEGVQEAKLSLAGTPVSENIDDSGQCDYASENPGNCMKRERKSLNYPYIDSKVQTYAVTPNFGKGGIVALQGKVMTILSTGDWDNPTQDFGTATLQTGDMRTASTLPLDWLNMQEGCKPPSAPACKKTPDNKPPIWVTDSCKGKDEADLPKGQDPIMLTIKVKVPPNAQSFSFKVFFLSREYPGLVCTEYNDFFVALLDSTYNEKNPGAKMPNPTDKNLAIDDKGNPLGVNMAPEGIFKICNPNCKTTLMGKVVSNTNKWGFCEGDQILKGTGFESKITLGQCDGNGGTGWLKVSGNVVPKEEITLRLAAWERGGVVYGPDHSYDTTVLIDDFKWSPTPTKPGVSPK